MFHQQENIIAETVLDGTDDVTDGGDRSTTESVGHAHMSAMSTTIQVGTDVSTTYDVLAMKFSTLAER